METRGILWPATLGRTFRLERRPAPDVLHHLVDEHWTVSWDLRGQEPYRSEVLMHPAVHLVFEPHGAAVFGVHRDPYVRVLRDQGWAVGAKFLPGGFASFIDRPVSTITDTVLALDEAFGVDGARLAREATRTPTLAGKQELLQTFLLTRLPESTDADAELVNAVVADMRNADPETRVAELAARHRVSVRTLQRLFARYVGVGPKWVLQRYRLHEAIERLERREHVNWTRFALELGYFDHAHFIRDFRAVVGRSPSQYEAETNAMVDH